MYHFKKPFTENKKKDYKRVDYKKQKTKKQKHKTCYFTENLFIERDACN